MARSYKPRTVIEGSIVSVKGKSETAYVVGLVEGSTVGAVRLDRDLEHGGVYWNMPDLTLHLAKEDAEDLLKIAKTLFHVETLETRRSDRLDFFRPAGLQGSLRLVNETCLGTGFHGRTEIGRVDCLLGIILPVTRV